jgi:diguanylate cyclase (GGDEF)-like protein
MAEPSPGTPDAKREDGPAVARLDGVSELRLDQQRRVSDARVGRGTYATDARVRREQSAQARLAAADERDVVSVARDVAATRRDEVAAARSRAGVRRTATAGGGARPVSASERIIRAAGQRKREARIRAEVAQQGAMASRDRRIAAQDREQAAFERLHALVDRERLADALAATELDPLTGARTRAAGLTDLDREVACCQRTGRSLVVAYVDVIGLKELNDTKGHRAGDDLLALVVALLKTQLRSYDLIVRLGGDEFLCAMTAMTVHDVRRRFADLAGPLAAASGGAAIRTGFAALGPGETAAALIARADGQLIARPHATHVPRTHPRSPAPRAAR